MKLRSSIFRGEVVHERLSPRRHRFSYPMTFFGFDLEELSTLREVASLFGYNEPRPLCLYDKDYLYGSHEAIECQLDKLLSVKQAGEHTMLFSSPRYFGYAFNPVNFHLRLRGACLRSVVAEVNNTFGDRHVYPLIELTKTGESSWSARCPKDFHVSPFNDMLGEYRFSFRITDEEVFLGVDLYKSGECVMKTWMCGEARPITNAAIIRYALLHPLDTALNSMPRIVWQAALLYCKKRMEVFKRPSPVSEHTIVDRDKADYPGSVV